MRAGSLASWMLVLKAFCWCPKLWFGRPGASIFAHCWTILAPWGHPGRPWEQQQEGRLGVWSRNLSNFETIWESLCESFLGTHGYTNIFVFAGLFTDHVLYQFWGEFWVHELSKKHFFRETEWWWFQAPFLILSLRCLRNSNFGEGLKFLNVSRPRESPTISEITNFLLKQICWNRCWNHPIAKSLGRNLELIPSECLIS